MSTVIKLLEMMSLDISIGNTEIEKIAPNEILKNLDSKVLKAFKNRDHDSLKTLLGARKTVICGILPGKDEDEDAPEPQQEKISAHFSESSIAFAVNRKAA